MLELLANLRTPAFGLIGPWAHGYPHITLPGPTIGFLSECERFFGRYLRDDDNGYESERPLRVYLQEFDPPAVKQLHRTGTWISVADWPAPDQEHAKLLLGDRSLASTRPDSSPGELQIGSAQSNGLAAGSWCPYGGPTLPGDQRPDDALSLCFDSEPLSCAVDVLGFPRLRLRLSSDRDRALVAARLCDLAPTGESLLVTRGILNLRHRDGHDRIGELRPGEAADLQLRLDAAGHRFAAGHRIRLAISPTYWPWVWPAREPVTLTLALGACELELPLLGAHRPADLGAAELTETVQIGSTAPSASAQVLVRDLVTDTVELRSTPDYFAGRWYLTDLGLEIDDGGENVYRIRERSPLSAEVRCRRQMALGRPGWEVRVEADAWMRSTAAEFLVDTQLRGFEGGKPVATRRLQTRVPRHD